MTDPYSEQQRLREMFPDDTNWRPLHDGLWCADMNNPFQQRRYVLIDNARNVFASTVASAEPLPGLEAEVRRHLAAEIEHQLLPTCVVPGCQEKAPYVFRAAEYGRLAGRNWMPGDEIRTCPEHGNAIYMAQGCYGLDQLAEWLRPDAKLDALDAYDAGADVLHGREIERNRARMLVVKRPAGGQP